MINKTERFELRLDPEILGRIDHWRELQGDRPSRAEAVRQLVDLGLGRGSLKLADSERLILMMLRDISKRLDDPAAPKEIDPDYLAECIHGGHFWGLEWQYSGLLHNHEDKREVVSEVVDILDMWDFLELSFNAFKPEERLKLLSEANYQSATLEFLGFDGNNEAEHRSIALFLVETMGRFSAFKGRSLNSHSPSLEYHREKLRVFERIRPRLDGRKMKASEIAAVIGAG